MQERVDKQNSNTRLIAIIAKYKGEFGWTVRLPAVSIKTAVAMRLDTVA